MSGANHAGSGTCCNTCVVKASWYTWPSAGVVNDSWPADLSSSFSSFSSPLSSSFATATAASARTSDLGSDVEGRAPAAVA